MSKYHDKCVRLVVQPGDRIPEIDCAQLQVVVEQPEATEDEEVKLEDVKTFNFEAIFKNTMAEFGIPAERTKRLWEMTRE